MNSNHRERSSNDDLDQPSREETIKNLHLALALIGYLYASGRFDPTRPTLRDAAWRYGADSTADMQELIEHAHIQSQISTSVGVKMSPEQLEKAMATALSVLSVLFVSDKFRFNDPAVAKTLKHCGMSEEDFRIMCSYMMKHMQKAHHARAIKHGPRREDPPPANFK